jgi:uncharacterized protein YmfQ (DUF2313 family)
MPVIDIYGEQVSQASQDPAPLDLTNLTHTPVVARQFPLGGAYFSRSAGWLPRTVRAIARFFSRLTRMFDAVQRQVDPRTADQLLPDRESERDIVSIPGQTLDERRDIVLAKMRAVGGVNAAYVQQLAINAGYLDAVVVAAGSPATCLSPCTVFVQSEQWFVTMHLTASSINATQDAALEALIRSQIQAGFFVIFTFT